MPAPRGTSRVVMRPVTRVAQGRVNPSWGGEEVRHKEWNLQWGHRRSQSRRAGLWHACLKIHAKKIK